MPRPPRRPCRGSLAPAILGACVLGTCVLGACVLAQAAAAQGTPRSVGECERLKNDLAYNQCLAMFGPAAKNVAGGYAAEGASSSALPASAQAASLPQAEEAPEEARSGRRGRYRVRRGRQSAVFTTGSSDGRSYRRRRRR